MINILITGGSGFLGSSIINHLSKKKKIRFFYLIRNKSNLTRINKYKKNVKILYNDKNIERLFLKKKN